jgi:putative membrane protein
MKNIGTVIGIVLIVVLVVLLIGGAGMMFGFGRFGMMGRGMMGGYASPLGFGLRLVGTLLSLVFWALIIGGGVWLVVRLVRGSSLAPNTSAPAQTSLDILKMRYAKGEITKEQFEQMKQDLA